MKRYRITPSLINALTYVWDLKTSEEKFEEATKNALLDFISTLKKEPKETSEAQQIGLDFEARCYRGEVSEDTQEIISLLQGGAYQVRLEKEIVVEGITFNLVGILDYLKGNTIYDIKKSASGSYTQLKYLHSSQHSAYFYLEPNASRFIYLYNDRHGETFKEQYLRCETPHIKTYISSFISCLKALNLWEVYLHYWEEKE